jgi:S1/P1 Nuclease
MRILIIVWFVAIFFTTPAYPWGAEGHQAIGEAARTMLTPKARIEIQKLLGDDDLASIAVWLDDVRNLAYHHSGPLRDDPEAMAFNAKFAENDSWHFVDLPVGFTNYSLGGPFSSPNDIVHALRLAIDVLEGKSSQFTKVQALRTIIHLVGDIHQPLHTVTGYYNLNDLEQPQLISDPADALGKPQDRGGNQLFYTKSQELHALWDTKLVVKVTTSTSFQQLAEILNRAPLAQQTPGDCHAWPMKWVEDSETVAIGAYEGVQFGPAKIGENGSIERIEIKLPSGYVPTQVSQVQLLIWLSCLMQFSTSNNFRSTD